MDAIEKYRDHCVDASHKAQESYDKAILSLSGGGLGVSLVYLKDVIGTRALVLPGVLWVAWITWTFSIVCILLSFFFSKHSLVKAIEQVDGGRIHSEVPGGNFAKTTERLNVLSGILFLLGVFFMLLFVYKNFGAMDAK